MNSDRQHEDGRRPAGTTGDPRTPWQPPKLTFATVTEDTGLGIFPGSDGAGPESANS
jgi:hypothetical protein